MSSDVEKPTALSDLVSAAGVRAYPKLFRDIGVPNWPFDHQMETIRQYARRTRFGDFSEPGCVSADTEFLTPQGWKRIDQYQEGDLVAQYDPNTHESAFVKPLAYVKEACDEMYVVRPSRGVSMKLCPEHRVLTFNQGGSHHRVDTMEDVAKAQERNVNGFRGFFRSTFEMDASGMDLEDADIRVMVMTMADGSFTSGCGTRCRLRVLKERKKKRCRELLASSGISYKEEQLKEGYSAFIYYAPRREKVFSGDWWNASSLQKKIILEEVENWDGSSRKSGSFTFTSLHQEDIDFVQFVALTSGRNATARMRDRTCQGRPMREGTVLVSGKGLMHSIASSSNKTDIFKEPTEDGFRYCFTVPSSFLVLRREGRVFTTGNCGKSFPAMVHAVLMASLGNKALFTMPPKLIRQFMQEMEDFLPGVRNHLKIDHLDDSGVKNAKKVKGFEAEGWPDILLISYDRFRSFNNRQRKRKIPWTQWYQEDGVTPYFKTVDGKRVREIADHNARPHTKDGQPIDHKGKADNPEQMRLKREGYNVMFFDEGHRLCNPDSQAFKACQHMDYELQDDLAIYLMTGTPVPTHLHDVYGVIRLINPGAYKNKQQFMRKHVVVNPNVKYLQVLGYKDEDTVHKKLYENARRVQKRDVSYLPDPIISSTPVRLSGPHKKLYDQVLQDRFALLGDQVLSPENDSALRQMALQLISCPDEFDPSGKLRMDNELTDACDTLMESINPEENKVILFAHYKKTVKFLAERYAKWNPAVMNGSSSSSWKQVDKFKEDPDCRVFIVNWESGGEGLNLQVASHLIFYECPTSPRHAKQAIARADRTGQTKVVNAYFFRVIGTLYDRNFKGLLKNERQNNKVVQDRHDLLYQHLGVSRRKAA